MLLEEFRQRSSLWLETSIATNPFYLFWRSKTLPGFAFRHFLHIEVETTSFCNRKCKYCPNVDFDKTSSNELLLMDEVIIDKILADLADTGFKGTFSPHMYGEPLLDPRISRIVGKIHSIGAKPKIFTNADYLSPSILDELISEGLDTLYISKHSASLSKGAKAALRYLFSKDRAYANREYSEIYSSILNKEVRINGIKLRIRDYYNDFRSNRTFLHNRGGSIDLELKKDAGPLACRYALFPVIDIEGNMVLCCNDYAGKHILGNVMERSIVDIWLDPANQILRRRIYRGNHDLEICKSCII